jgi:hypothetical protein
MELKAFKNESSGIWDIQGLEKWTVTYQDMIDKLQSNKAFKFARYGDGEIYCMNGKQGHNCDNHIYFPDLGKALKQTITEEPLYQVGIQPLSISHIPEQVNAYFSHFKRLYNADVLHNASIDRSLNHIMDAMDSRYVILVGPLHLSSLFENCIHIIIPKVNCWLEYVNIKQQIHFHTEGINNAVVLLAASMMSEVLISDFEDYPHTFIDVGSVFDVYCGVKSRKYHYKMSL